MRADLTSAVCALMAHVMLMAHPAAPLPQYIEVSNNRGVTLSHNMVSTDGWDLDWGLGGDEPTAPPSLALQYKLSLSSEKVEKGKQTTVTARGPGVCDNMTLISSNPNVASLASTSCVVEVLTATVVAHTVGQSSISLAVNGVSLRSSQIRVVKSELLVTINMVIGWIYFVAWSISFYPQVRFNWMRKSVVGLNFDFLAYNLTGFLGYMFYNIAMYYMDSVKAQYTKVHGVDSTNPVQLNDVIFTMHAVVLTAITIVQCCMYERGKQRVSLVCKILVSGAWVYAIVTAILASCNLLDLRWLNFLQGLAFIKMGVTLIKYIPQAYMNFKRKSTLGWSIGNVLLDFTGGSFSLLQMFLQYWNNNDATIFLGDPVKLFLAIFSMVFDILFFVQHYCLYRHSGSKDLGYKELLEDDYDDDLYNGRQIQGGRSASLKHSWD